MRLSALFFLGSDIVMSLRHVAFFSLQELEVSPRVEASVTAIGRDMMSPKCLHLHLLG